MFWLSFVDTLITVRNRHHNVVPTMAQGILEYKDGCTVDPVTNQNLQYFLDRFYMNRISTRMLMNQHSKLGHHGHDIQRRVWNGSRTPTRRPIIQGLSFFYNGSFNPCSPDIYNNCFYLSTVLIFSDSQTGNPTHIGSIDPNCDVAAVIQGNF